MASPLPTTSIADAVHQIQLYLIETAACTERQLFAAGDLLSQPDYEDVVVERTITGLCGYPLCPNSLPPDRPPSGRFRIALREHRVYDLQETYKYCSLDCLIGSRAFSGSLKEERCSDLSSSKIYQVLGLFDHGSLGEDLGKDGDLGLSNLVIQEKGYAEAGEVSLDEWIGPSDAIEGYVPHYDRRQGSKFSSEANVNPPNKSSRRSEDVSEMIAKQLEDVVISEKKMRKDRTSSKSSKPKNVGGINEKMSGKMDFSSSIVIGDGVNAVVPRNISSVSMQEHSRQLGKDLKDASHSEEKKVRKTTTLKGLEDIGQSGGKTELKETALKSSLRSSGSKVGGRSVKWADDRLSGALEERRDALESTESSQVSHEEDDNPLRFASAEACAAASIQAAEAIASGESEAGDVALEERRDALESTESSQVSHEEDDNPLRFASAEACAGASIQAAEAIASGESEAGDVALEERRDALESTESSQISHEEDDNSLRFASAEACAAALIQAAKAIASGESEAGDAVSDAGILILPQAQSDNDGSPEADEDIFEFDQGFVKWPTKPVLLDTDMFDVEDSWHDTPPDGFNLTLSSFATMWMALFGWITCSSLAYIYGHDENSQDDFLLVNGREYPCKIVMRDGKSSEIRQTLDGCVCRALPGLVMNLRLPTPISTLEKAVGHLLDTMTFADAVPSFRTKQWHVIVLLFIDALSVRRIPALAPHMTNRDMLGHKVLSSTGISGEEYESMRDLIMPLGRLPQFSMHCGG